MIAFLQALTFTTPIALTGLLLLPLIWWLLRFTPPKPQTIRFPPLRLLLGLVNTPEQPDKTPLWLLLLRMAIAALVIVAVAHPSYAPNTVWNNVSQPVLVIVDDTWAAARNWSERVTIMKDLVNTAREKGVTLSLATSAPSLRTTEIAAYDADKTLSFINALEPKALAPDRLSLLPRLQKAFAGEKSLRVVWISDGLDQSTATPFVEGLKTLATNRSVEVLAPEPQALPLVFAAPTTESGALKLHVRRAAGGAPQTADVRVFATNGRNLADVKVDFTSVGLQAEARLELPIELRNEVQRLEIVGERNAAATFLFDDRWRRKTIALQSGGALEDAQPLLSPLYYVSRALEPFAEISEPENADVLTQQLDAGLSMLILADIGLLAPKTRDAIKPWLERGGVLLRFAGPRLASSHDELLPVAIREGGRALGSALSWERPQHLQPFPEKSPFVGLPIDDNVTVSRQVLAEPDSELSAKVWASLADGTPLVTASREGKGLNILFHVTANADWSNLPLSGLFVEMLRRITDLAPGAGGGAAPGAIAVGGAFTPRFSLSASGEITDPLPDSKPIPAAEIDRASPSPATPAGLYARGSNERAVNVIPSERSFSAITSMPAGVTLSSLVPQPRQPLAPLLFSLALLLFLADTLAALVMGRVWLRRAAVALVLCIQPPLPAVADDGFAMKAAQDTRLAFITTGNPTVDEISEQGLKGLSLVLADRTSVSPADPMAINIETDDIVFFPIIYWPVIEGASAPSTAALSKMSDYMKNGGTIFFDLRDDQTGFEDVGPSTQALRQILDKLDIPALEPVSEGHVLTKSFYLMHDFPGRYAQGPLWVERTDQTAASTSDGVSSIIIGSNDFAAAWAMDENGNPQYATVGGSDRQREMAFRAGVNIVMYALTGNYKADQVHIPALLERLGQ